jgi:Asp-tRNA(Asn)/Glu-tRNA(Gln) amidotransferase B subunit
MNPVTNADPNVIRAEIVRQLEHYRVVRDNILVAFPVSEALREKPELVNEYLNGKETLLNHFVGRVYKKAKELYK